MTRDGGYKSGTVPEIPGQLEPMLIQGQHTGMHINIARALGIYGNSVCVLSLQVQSDNYRIAGKFGEEINLAVCGFNRQIKSANIFNM